MDKKILISVVIPTRNGESTIRSCFEGIFMQTLIAKTEVVRDTESFADIVRGLHVFGRKVLRSGAVYSSVLVIT